MTLRQVAIIIVNPIIDINQLSVEALIAPEPTIIGTISMLTAAIDIPCRRAPPTLQSYHHGTVVEDGEGALGEFVATRLLRLSKVGPLSVVTYGGSTKDWPALRAVWLRHGITTCDFGFGLDSQVSEMGQRSREFIDLRSWIGQGIGCHAPHATAAMASDDPTRSIPAIYHAMNRWLLIQGQMSKPVHDRAVERFPDEWRQIGKAQPRGPPRRNL
jgi:hypothetical protein